MNKAASLTPQGYADMVSAHACQTLKTSLYSGELFHRLAKFLNRPREPHLRGSSSAHVPHSPRQESFAVFYDLSAASGMSIRPLSTAEELRTWVENDGEVHQRGSMLFLRGYSSPQWLAGVGSALNVDPTIFQRHLANRSSIGDCNLFFSPSLPSAEEGILQLQFVTVGRRWPKGSGLSQSDAEKLRLDGELGMSEYLRELSAAARVSNGDSIVRSFHTHDEETFSIEQQMSISVQRVGQKWAVFVWSDAGRNLGEGTPGPWRGSRHQNSEFLPSLQHLPNLPFRSRMLAMSAENKLDGNFAQSAALLSAEYGKSLDRELMCHDAFYSLHELFRFCAFSTSQFLNVIDSMIAPDTGHAVATDEQYNLSNLLYHQGLLEQQEKQLRTAIRTIGRRGDASWPRAQGSLGREKAAAAAASLLRDYEELLGRAMEISKRCKVGVSVIMSLASIAESKRAIEQAKKVEQLTLLAFFYIPLSFTTSFFGMNLGALSTGELAIWVWFALSIPVLLGSFGLLKIIY